jgi:hypothetical protein
MLDLIIPPSPSSGADSMPKQKSNAQIHVADGAGGMRPVADLRFEAGQWPIELTIPAKDAENWMAHLSAEVEEHGWSSSSFSQLDATENSGTLSVGLRLRGQVLKRLRGQVLKYK